MRWVVDIELPEAGEGVADFFSLTRTHQDLFDLSSVFAAAEIYRAHQVGTGYETKSQIFLVARNGVTENDLSYFLKQVLTTNGFVLGTNWQQFQSALLLIHSHEKPEQVYDFLLKENLFQESSLMYSESPKRVWPSLRPKPETTLIQIKELETPLRERFDSSIWTQEFLD